MNDLEEQYVCVIFIMSLFHVVRKTMDNFGHEASEGGRVKEEARGVEEHHLDTAP
jgi:hypothetical protein